ncbi:MAG TPA: hypothetical protein VEG44_03625 [Candidatus Acidoferrales bacterium]|nr:hypothetical protein [Candidatus Acidoferrales bacterium]
MVLFDWPWVIGLGGFAALTGALAAFLAAPAAFFGLPAVPLGQITIGTPIALLVALFHL